MSASRTGKGRGKKGEERKGYNQGREKNREKNVYDVKRRKSRKNIIFGDAFETERVAESQLPRHFSEQKQKKTNSNNTFFNKRNKKVNGGGSSQWVGRGCGTIMKKKGKEQ